MKEIISLNNAYECVISPVDAEAGMPPCVNVNIHIKDGFQPKEGIVLDPGVDLRIRALAAVQLGVALGEAARAALSAAEDIL